MSDPREQELIDKVTALCRDRFSSDWLLMFTNYSESGFGERIALPGVVSLLTDAGVGSRWTRSAWGRALIGKLDTNEDARISWGEFLAVLGTNGGK